MLLRIAIVLIGVGAVAGIASAIAWHYNDDHDRTVEYRLVNQDGTPVNQNGGSVVVVRDDHWRGRPFFPAFPLVIIGGVLLTVALVSRNRGGGWGGPGGGRFDDWHREAHRTDAPPPPANPAQ
jgi:hypothetical protein